MHAGLVARSVERTCSGSRDMDDMKADTDIDYSTGT